MTVGSWATLPGKNGNFSGRPALFAIVTIINLRNLNFPHHALDTDFKFRDLIKKRKLALLVDLIEIKTH